MVQSDQLTIGSAVLTFDNEALGRVAAVRGEYFKVEALGRGTSGSPSATTEIRSEHIRLGYPRDSLGEYKREEPERG